MASPSGSLARVVLYETPRKWISYDALALNTAFVEAKASAKAMATMPFLREWVAPLQEMQLKREVAGTSRIEGAEFTEVELEGALRPDTPPDGLRTRSQRQARAAVETYRWIATIEDDRPIDGNLIREIHRRIVTGCDDDHCPPGRLRENGQNVVFGIPRHRGVEGGEACSRAFDELAYAIQHEFRGHDPLIQALAAHYHLAAMHPFLDGNGRTARALEALMLLRAGVTDMAFIGMSNYYYEEKTKYLAKLSAARAAGHDLTEFLKFALEGIEVQCIHLRDEIRKNTQREMFRNVMYRLFNRLETKRKRVLGDRQIEILKALLDVEKADWHAFSRQMLVHYKNIQNSRKMLARDMASLVELGAVKVAKRGEDQWDVAARLQWPHEITESEFFAKIRKLPSSHLKFLP